MNSLTGEGELLFIGSNSAVADELNNLFQGAFHVAQSKDCGAAKKLLEENEPHIDAVLLSDTNNASEESDFLKYIADDVKLSSIPVLLLIEGSDTQDQKLQFENGIADCIKKPYNKKICLNRIRNAITMNDSLTYFGIEKMLKELPSNIYLKDSEGRYVFATHYWHHLDHKDDPNWTIRGKTDPEIRKDRENAIAAQEKDREIIATGRGVCYTIEINTDGIQEFFEIIKQPIFNDAGKVKGIIGLINNVTDHELLKMKLEARARTDELTGVYNRTYFDEYFHSLLQKDCYPVSVISADCDDLKKMNDTYGHLVGDDYIRMTVMLFKMVMPEAGALFRTGGDEFIIILPSTGREEAKRLVQQMKEREKLFQIRGTQLSVSLGVSCLENSIQSVEECIAESDRNMYKDKRNKKGKVLPASHFGKADL